MKKRTVIIIAVILVVALVSGILFFSLRDNTGDKKSSKNKDTSSKTSSSVMLEDIESEENKVDITDEIIDDGTGIKPDESIKPSTDNRTGEKAEEPSKPKAPVKAEDAAKPIKEEKKYVQDANPETGISWDGKSAIVYRLMSGEETYTKTYGAYYELRPNEWVLLEEPTEKEVWDGKCHHCGKVSADGKNGTCVRWMMGDEICPNCGKEVKANTCHTCKE